MRGSKVVGGDLKSAAEIKGSVAGGLKRSESIEGTFGAKANRRQQAIEQRVLAEARKQGGKLVIEGVNVMTEQVERIEVDPLTIARRLRRTRTCSPTEPRP